MLPLTASHLTLSNVSTYMQSIKSFTKIKAMIMILGIIDPSVTKPKNYQIVLSLSVPVSAKVVYSVDEKLQLLHFSVDLVYVRV